METCTWKLDPDPGTGAGWETLVWWQGCGLDPTWANTRTPRVSRHVLHPTALIAGNGVAPHAGETYFCCNFQEQPSAPCAVTQPFINLAFKQLLLSLLWL